MNQPDPERWRVIEECLDRVLDSPESERARILDEVEDPSLRREVEKLLAASEEAGSRFETPPLLVAREVLREPETVDPVEVGRQIGPWRTVRLLGRGGMGAVYLAERADGAFDKAVALKIVKRGMDTDEIVRRFHQERKILARLEHPNIAGLIDGGVTDDGMPYFVMELAVGEPIDEWCDARTLLVRERLRLFRTVCEAVQYAHGNLVIHRDLKPPNVVVSGGEVKLLDFGIAKLLGAEDAQAVITQTNEARLTPRYAAPEQVRGLATTTATDVYSLGIILYELLTGRPPFRLSGRTLLEMQVIICTEDPLRPSAVVTRSREGKSAVEIARSRGLGRPETLQQMLRGDLDAICLKALCKAPEERYGSPIALADDIERYLEGRPVRAMPPSRSYRARKFVQRNRAAVALGALTGLVLAGATIATVVSAAAARRQGLLRQQEAERATVARDFVVNMLGSFDPDEQPGRRQLTTAELIQVGIANLDALDVQPSLKATVMNTLGQVAFNMGERSVADSLFRGAYAILAPTGDNADLANTMMGIGQILQRDQKYVDAANWYRRALDARQQNLEPLDRRTAEAQRALAFALYNIDGDAASREAEALYSDLLARPDLPADLQAAAIEGLGDLRLRAHELPQAESLYTRVLVLRRATQPEGHPDIARALWGLGTAVRDQDRLAEAEADYRESLEILMAAYGPRHRDVAFAWYFLGQALSLQQRDAEAEDAFRQAAEISADVNPPGHSFTAQAFHYTGLMASRAGDETAALHWLERSRSVSLEALANGQDSAAIANQVVSTDIEIASRLASLNRKAEALELLREAVRFPADSANARRAADHLADMEKGSGETPDRPGPSAPK
jgi:eukaryotic-like serine/threonine-protein kinase